MNAEVMQITPDLAREWLERNPINRKLSPPHVQKIALAIISGEWAMNGEAIKFNCDGTLLDGQHRLAAIIEAGIAVPSLVITGIEQQAQGTMDLGRSRSLIDFLRMDGVPNVSRVASIVTTVNVVEHIWNAQDNGLAGNQQGDPETVGSARARYHAQADRYQRAYHLGERLYRVLGWPVSAVGGVSFYAQATQPDVWEYFVESVVSGENLSHGDPALALRSAAMKKRSDRHSSINRVWAFGITTKAWNAFASDERMMIAKFVMNGSRRETLPRVL
jgi:hypothetical protein